MWLSVNHLSPPSSMEGTERQDLLSCSLQQLTNAWTEPSAVQAFSKYLNHLLCCDFPFLFPPVMWPVRQTVRASILESLFSHFFLPPLLRKVCNERASGLKATGTRATGSGFLRFNLVVTLSWIIGGWDAHPDPLPPPPLRPGWRGRSTRGWGWGLPSQTARR